MNKRLLALLLVCMLGLVACGDDNGDEVEVDDPSTDEVEDDEVEDEAEDDEADDSVTVTATDYAFAVPATIPVGTELTIDNQGSEPHEVSVFHIPDEEERSLEELLALPEDEEPPLNFKGVVIQLTDGSDPITPEGPVVVDEPGRYALVCFFPVGLTDAELQEAMAEMDPDAEDPPPLPEGPPHFTEGMLAEVTVE